MAEGFVGFGHLVDVFALFDGAAFVVTGVDEFSSEFFDHVFSVALFGIRDDPTRCESLFALGANFHGNLVSSSTHAT